MKKSEIKIKVYLRGGKVFSGKVRNELKAEEFAKSIIAKGCSKVEGNLVSYYPTHQILKVTYTVENVDKQRKINLIG